MKIAPVPMDTHNPDTLRTQLTQLQDRINNALRHVGYEFSQQLKIKSYPESFPVLVAHQLPQPVWGLKLVYLRNLTDDTAVPTNDVFVDWIPEYGAVKIRGVNGLTPTHLYELRFLAYA